MLGATRVDVRDQRQLLRKPELRVAFRGHGVCGALLPEWDVVVVERYVQWKWHVHRRRDAKLRALYLLRRNRALPGELHGQHRLRCRVRLRLRRVQATAIFGVHDGQSMRFGILHRRGVL